jgi:hypothetical protein
MTDGEGELKASYAIVINGEEKIVHKAEQRFHHILDLAFPPPRPAPDKDYKITYKHAASVPHHGSLHPGEAVEVKNGTNFDVSPTNKS